MITTLWKSTLQGAANIPVISTMEVVSHLQAAIDTLFHERTKVYFNAGQIIESVQAVSNNVTEPTSFIAQLLKDLPEGSTQRIGYNVYKCVLTYGCFTGLGSFIGMTNIILGGSKIAFGIISGVISNEAESYRACQDIVECGTHQVLAGCTDIFITAFSIVRIALAVGSVFNPDQIKKNAGLLIGAFEAPINELSATLDPVEVKPKSIYEEWANRVQQFLLAPKSFS